MIDMDVCCKEYDECCDDIDNLPAGVEAGNRNVPEVSNNNSNIAVECHTYYQENWGHYKEFLEPFILCFILVMNGFSYYYVEYFFITVIKYNRHFSV